MNIDTLCSFINKGYVISEHLRKLELLPYMDMVIDDINTRLQSSFPTFTEWPSFVEEYNAKLEEINNEHDTDLPRLDPAVYSVIPAKYLRSVVAVGAALNFFTNDEEGEQVSTKYYVVYEQNMFTMIRDFHELVPCIFRNEEGGFIINTYNHDEHIPACVEGIVMRNGYFDNYL